ncbi:MAG: hypothetical protein RRZ71_02665 [Clostridia bacterium]
MNGKLLKRISLLLALLMMLSIISSCAPVQEPEAPTQPTDTITDEVAPEEPATAAGTRFTTNDENIEMIEVNQVMSYGQNIDDGSLFPMENFVSGKDTIIFVKTATPAAVNADGTQRLTVSKDGEQVAELLPMDSAESDRIAFIPPSLEDVGNWEQGEYTLTYTTEDGCEATRIVNFNTAKSIKVLAVPVLANYAGQVVDVEGEWKTAIQFTAETYPLAKGAIEYILAPSLDLSDISYDLTTDEGMFNVWSALTNLQTPNNDYELILGFVRNRQGEGNTQGYTYGLPANIITESDGDMQPTVAHEIAHCYQVGDEYPGGAINPAINPAPCGMEGSDWNNRDETIVSNKQFVVGGNDIGQTASGSVIPLDQFPVNAAQQSVLSNNVSSFMGSGSSNISDYWITSAIWEQLYKSFVFNDTSAITTSSTEGSQGDQGSADGQPSSDTMLPCQGCNESYAITDYNLYAVCESCEQLTSAQWGSESVTCEYCGEEIAISTDNSYILCPDENCSQISALSDYVQQKREQKVSADTAEPETEVATAEEEKTYRAIDIKGNLKADDTFAPEPWFSYDTTEFPRALKGDYTVEMMDASGKLLSKHCFDVSFYTQTNPPKKLDFSPINLTVFYPDATAKIAITKEGKEIYSVNVSANAPEIEFVGLKENKKLSGEQTISWKGSDQDGDKLIYELWYCTDEGDFVNVASNITATSCKVNFDTLPGSDNAYLYLYATDGTVTAQMDSPYLSVNYKAPEILTKQPTVPEYKITDEILLSADVYDMQDGWLYGDDQVVWVDGSGREYTTGSLLWIYPYELTPGEHTFTMTATNSKGVSSSAKYTFKIANDESALPNDWSKDDVRQALSNGFIAPLANVKSPITRGQYAALMTNLYFTVVDENTEILEYEDGIVTDCGSDDYSQFLMAKLGFMEAKGGKFAPNDALTEEEAAKILYNVVITATKVDDGVETAMEDIIAELTDAKIIDDIPENTYQAANKITGQLALVRCNRLWEFFFGDTEG